MADELVEITVRGFKELLEQVASHTLSDKNSRRITNAVGANLLNTQRRRFLEAVDPDGKPWPVSFAALGREASGRGGKTLFDTGTLFHSIQFGLLGDNVGEIGTDVPYARKHQLGEDGLPARVFLGFTDADAEGAAVIAAALMDKISG